MKLHQGKREYKIEIAFELKFIFTKIVQYLFRCYMTDTTEKMLVLEDLRANQFKIVNSMVGLDAEHLKLTLLTLARWHAGTATLLLTVEKYEFS